MMTTPPTPGDMVRCTVSLAEGVPAGAYGVIEGVVHEVRDTYPVRFMSRSTFLSVVCEGEGGVVVQVPQSQLVLAGAEEWLSYWLFDYSGKERRTIRRRNLARVWEWTPKEES